MSTTNLEHLFTDSPVDAGRTSDGPLFLQTPVLPTAGMLGLVGVL